MNARTLHQKPHQIFIDSALIKASPLEYDGTNEVSEDGTIALKESLSPAD